MPEKLKTKTPVSEKSNAASLADFTNYVSQLKQTAKRHYDRNINKDLSSQNWPNLFKRNVTSVLQQAYRDSLDQLQCVSFTPEKMELENGFSQLAVQILTTFEGFIDDILQYALQKHRTSCALSNFPDEHRPSEEYIVDVIQETTRDWKAFASQVNAILTADLSS